MSPSRQRLLTLLVIGFGSLYFLSVNAQCTGEENDFDCRPDNETKVDCSGAGVCVCGTCECKQLPNAEEVISGKYCECDNFSCDRNKNLLCSGPDHGTCECGRCVCKPGWVGSSCDCRKSSDTCMSPDGLICSGHGFCSCGMCKCDSHEDGRFSGQYCERCPTCAGRCQELKDCVQCQMYKTGPLKKVTDCMDCTFTPIAVEKVTINEEEDEHLCIFYDEDDCKFSFKYAEINNKVEVTAQQDRKCPPKLFMPWVLI